MSDCGFDAGYDSKTLDSIDGSLIEIKANQLTKRERFALTMMSTLVRRETEDGLKEVKERILERCGGDFEEALRSLAASRAEIAVVHADALIAELDKEKS